MFLWIFLYKKVKVQECKPQKKVPYFITSILTLVVVAIMAVGGIRGDFKHSTRPINLVDANKFVKNPNFRILFNSNYFS